MIKKSSCMLLLLALAAVIGAAAAGSLQAAARQEDDQAEIAREAAEAFLAEVKAKYALPFENGVESFEAELKFRGGQNPDLEWITEAVTVAYAWKAPAEERMTVVGVPEAFHGLLREPLRGLWKDMVGGHVFPGLAGKTLSVEGGEKEIVLHVSEGPGRIVFEPATHLVLRAEAEWDGTVMTVEPVFSVDDDGLLRLVARTVTVDSGGEDRGRVEMIYEYGAFRFCGPNALPTSLTLKAEGKQYTYNIAYGRINGREAVLDAVDPEQVKALVREFERKYSKMSSSEKQRFMTTLEETGHETAALSIAGKCLKDRDLEIRAAAARTLGAMSCLKTLPALTKALKPNERNVDVYLALIKALGDLGDPRAIPFLSKDFWNQKDAAAGIRAAQAKITALGYIRSKKSVDALIDMLYAADPLSMMSVAAHLQASLKRLTGEDFGWDRDRWRGWWKRNERTFKLPDR